ncbi:translation initiation factor IF-2-like isoform X2 [Acinonyx jubatus]|uniref:Translation initiation factor IF-2-like isoform X2 n=1 Tax=Acinonyx jubatus TaxID=32536 RepID=A0ABM3Q334_ACIJB|nr:translation initiation factor IF-2-like isoform X2 [Acinonyx jubatus]
MARPPGPSCRAKALFAGARSPLPETRSADPAPGRRTQCKHSALSARRLPAGGGGGAALARTHISAPLVTHRGKGEEGGGEGRGGSDAPRAGGVRACARRGGQPGRPAGSRPRPAPAYLPGSLRRLAPRAPS